MSGIINAIQGPTTGPPGVSGTPGPGPTTLINSGAGSVVLSPTSFQITQGSVKTKQAFPSSIFGLYAQVQIPSIQGSDDEITLQFVSKNTSVLYAIRFTTGVPPNSWSLASSGVTPEFSGSGTYVDQDVFSLF